MTGGVSNRIKSLENFVYGGYTRYVRVYPGKNDVGEGHIVEVQAISSNTNVALNKPIYFSENFVLNKNFGAKTTKAINDGSTSAYNYAGVLFRDGQSYLTIDLLSHYNLDEVKLWQYYLDGRTYQHTKIQVSQNDVDYYTIFDADVDGTYKETSAGKTVAVPNDIYI